MTEYRDDCTSADECSFLSYVISDPLMITHIVPLVSGHLASVDADCGERLVCQETYGRSAPFSGT